MGLKEELKKGIESVEKRHSYLATYQYGHPGVKPEPGASHGISCFIIVDDRESDLIVRRRSLLKDEELFRIPYEKIESVTTDINKDWSGSGRLPQDLSLRGMIFGSKADCLGLTVRGKDKEGNVVPISILFTHVSMSTKVKARIDSKIGEERGITI